jgi:hypothetical protein
MKIMKRKMFLAAALFAALVSAASAQGPTLTVGGDPLLNSKSKSWIGQSGYVFSRLFTAPVTADYLITLYVNMSNDTSGGSDTDETCPILGWADEFGGNQVTDVCAAEVGALLPANYGAGTKTIHVFAGSEVQLDNPSVLGWVAGPHTYDMIVTWTKLNP